MSLVTHAATLSWNGGSGGQWDDPTNWQPQQVPGAEDTAVIGGTEETVVAVTGTRSVGRLVLDNPNGFLRLVGNSSIGGPANLTVANGFENRGTIDLTSSTPGNTADLTVTSGVLTNAADGVIRALLDSGGTRRLKASIDNRGALVVEENLAINGTFANNGTIHLAEGKTLSVPSGSTWTYRGGSVTGTGTLSMGDSSTLVLEGDLTPGTFVIDAPNLTVNGPAKLLGPSTGEFVIRQWTINAGVVVSGDIRISGTVAMNGALSVAPGKTLRLVGNSSIGGPANLTVANGFENRGTIDLTSSTSGNTADLTVTSGVLTNAADGVIRALLDSGGTRRLKASIDNRGALVVEENLAINGTFANNGTIHLAEGKTLSVPSGSTWTYRGGSVTGTGTLSMGDSSTLVLEGDLTPGTFVIDAPNLTVNGPAKLLGPSTGEFVIRQWTINAGVVVSGDIRISGTVAMNGALLVAPGKTLRLVGNSSIGGPANLTVANGFENRGTIDLTSSTPGNTADLTVTSGVLTNAADGVIRALLDSGGTRRLKASIDNRGALVVEENLAINGTFANNGTIHLAEGKTLSVPSGSTWTYRGGSVTGTGTLSMGDSSTLVLEGDLTPGTFVIDAPNLTVNGPAKLLGPSTGEFVIRQWTINAGVVVSGDIRISGTVAMNGALLVAPGKTLRLVGNSSIGGPANLTVANGFENRGTIDLTSSTPGNTADLTVTSGVLTNAADGVIRALRDSGGTRRLKASIDNRGALVVEENLAINGTFANNGTIHLAEGKTLSVPSGSTWTYRGGSVTGTGTLSMGDLSTLVLEGDLTPGTFVIDAPNLTVNGPAKLLGPSTGEFVIRQWTINAGVVVSGDIRISGTVAMNGALSVAPGKTLRLVGNSSIGGPANLTVANGFENRGTIDLTSSTSGNTADLTVTSGVLTNAADGVIRALRDSGGTRRLKANIDNRGALVAMTGATFDITGDLLNTSSGVLTGGGAFDLTGATVTQEGILAPGDSSGFMTIRGNLPHGQGSRFEAEIGGFTPGTQHDQLILANPATLGGAIRPVLIDGFFPKKDDAFTVLTYPSRTGTFAALDNPLPERIAWEVRYGATSAQLVVLNTAPTLTVIPPAVLDELTSLSVTASATDQDLPAQTLTYALAEAPAGMTIHPSTGVISWTPSEAQGPGVHDVTVRVTDNGTPALGHTTRFTVTVHEVNVAPQLVLPEGRAVDEQTEFVFALAATDPDLPANTLSYEMVSGPPGATFDAATREFRWTPTEADGPGNFTASFRVTDNNPDAVNAKRLSTDGLLTFAVREVNRPPVLTAIGGQTVAEESALAVAVVATDPDLPVNGLTYSLDSAPSGMTIDPGTGVIGWTPGETQGPATHEVVVRVTDHGTPALGNTTRFTVSVSEVNRAPELAAIPSSTVHAEAPFVAALTATDPDVPANAFTYVLVGGPAEATVTAEGRVTWTPSLADVGKVAEFTVRVADGGEPTRTDEETFRITVAGPVEISSTTRDGETWTIFWRAVAGNTYRLVRTPGLAPAEWEPLSEEVLATGDTASQTVSLGAESPAGFVRVERVR